MLKRATLKETQELAHEISLKVMDGNIILLNGEMGSGKTQFVRFLCSSLKVKDRVSSPSFIIMNKYETSEGLEIFHFDFYRLTDMRDLEEIGLFEILESKKGLVIVEWANMFKSLFVKEKHIIDIYFNFIEDNINLREISIQR